MSENRPQMTVQSAVEVVAAVVDVEQGEKVLRIYREEQAPVDFVCMAHGTARTEMLDLLGIGETAKAIVMCMVSRQTGVRLLKRLGRELEMRYPGRGIAFAIPITGIGLRWHKLLTATDEEQKEVSRMHETEKNDGFDVVAVVMERGYTNVAMDAARRVNDTKNKDNDTQNDRMFDFMLKQWDDFSMLEYVRHETHYSQEVMSEKLGLTRKKYRKYEKEIMYPDADTLVQMYNLYKCRPSMYLNMYDRRYYVMQNVWMELDDNQRDRILRMVKAIKNII